MKAIDPKMSKVAFVGVYKIECGISTYSEWLWQEMAKQVREYKIFAERIDAITNDPPEVVRCWTRGKPLHALIQALLEYDPDVIYIQHEWGIFPIGTHFLSFMTAINKFRVITTLHSVYHHKDKLICEAALPEIIVHTEAARKILVEQKKVSGKVHVIPHGCFPCQSTERYWNRYASNHLLIQVGFGFKYKGWINSLKIVSELRRDFPDLFFTGVFSETPNNKQFHDLYFNELMQAVNELGIQDHVGFIRGFQSDETLDAFFRTNHIGLFPYIENGEHTVYGCSGAARIAMTKGLPIVVSRVPLFDDLEGVVPRVTEIEEYCQVIKHLFEDKNYKAQVQKQNEFLAQNSWAISAKRYLEIL